MCVDQEQTKWLTLFRQHAPPDEVAQAWYEGLDEDIRRQAKDDAPTVRAMLRRYIVDSKAPEVRSDADNGWKYTAKILRAADAVLGMDVSATRRSGQDAAGGAAPPAASGSGAPAVSRVVIPGHGEPGTLGIFWSDFGGASDSEQLRARGVTRRLNVASEAVGRLPQDDGIPTTDVPMEDIFDEDKASAAVDKWIEQLGEVVSLLRGWREEGAVVNVNCQMGKNRSGCAILVWLCSECGQTVEEAVEYLRGITALACANPHLIKAVAMYLKVDADVPLNPAGDGGGWVCISPPGSPRVGGTQVFEDAAKQAFAKLAAEAATNGEDQEAAAAGESRPSPEDSGDDLPEGAPAVAGLFEDLSDVD